MAKLERITFKPQPFDGKQEFVLDWDNDRHQAIEVNTSEPEDVIRALERLVMVLKQENHYGNI